MKKVIVIGCPGSGKSTFSRALHERTGLPLYHLDLLFCEFYYVGDGVLDIPYVVSLFYL